MLNLIRIECKGLFLESKIHISMFFNKSLGSAYFVSVLVIMLMVTIFILALRQGFLLSRKTIYN